MVIAGAGCGASAASQPPASPPTPPVLVATEVRGCADAAAGLERATYAVREPGVSILAPIRQRCTDDGWSAAAIECFARMVPDDLGPCARELPARSRDALFAVLSGNQDDQVSMAIVVAKLSILEVGIPDCDRFVSAVAAVLSCERMPVAARVQLGNETAELWSLPVQRLSHAAHARMAAACGESLHALQQQAVDVGCMP